MHSRITSRPAAVQLKHLTLGMLVLLAAVSSAAAQQAAPDTTRPRSIDHSDAYYTRLTIHRIGSYAELPLFGAEYLLGQKLYNGTNVADWVKPAHVGVATGLGALFAINTVTGVWNLYEARKDPSPARRIVHAALMLAADAGFLYTASLAGDADERFEFGESENGAARHRNAAIVSFSLATAGTVVMWLWKPKSD